MASLGFKQFMDTTVLELGSGASPLASMTAALLGARRVLVTDGSQRSLSLARTNAVRNLPSATAERLHFQTLMWGDAEGARALQSQLQHRPIDMIVAADVLYEEAACTLLADTIDALASAGTEVYIAHQVRLHSFETTFFDDLADVRGFRVERVVRTV